MLFSSHQANDLPELEEVIMFPGDQRISVEERDDHSLQIDSVDRVRHDTAVRTLRCETSTAEELPNPLENHDVVAMLVRLEHRCDQPSPRILDRRMRSDAYREAAFSIDESSYVIRSE